METFLILAFVFILIIVVAVNTLNEDKKRINSQSVSNIVVNSSVNNNIEKQQIQVKVGQTLETIHIIETSKNLDTIVGRYDFLKNIFNGTSETTGLRDYVLREYYSECM
jgi:uncharacterized membrane protein YhiD involved in acid resistance